MSFLANFLYMYFLATYFAIVMLTRALRKKSVSRRQPPSLPSLPLVGSLPFIWKFSNIHEYFRSKAEQLGPIFTFRVGRRLCLTLNSREVIEEALMKNATCFAGREHFYLEKITNKSGKGIVAMNFSADFKHYHKLSLSILREFGFGTNRLMETRISEELEALNSAISYKNGKAFDPNELLLLSTYNIVKNIVLGQREDFVNGFDEILKNLVSFIGNITPAMDAAPALLNLIPYFRRKAKICVECVSRINKRLEKDINAIKKDCKVECFVSRYLTKIGSNYDQEQLIYTARDLIAAGYETTSATLLWLMIFIANNPATQKRLQNEVDAVIPRHRLPSLDDQPRLPFFEATILETMRLRTITPLAAPHLTLSDSEVCGYFVPAKTKVFVNLHAAHMDPAIWKDPDNFRPERFLDEYTNIIGRDRVISFSLGRRSCLGEMLARQEIFLFLAGWIQKFNILPGEDKLIDDKPVVDAVVSPRPFEIRMIPRGI